MRVAQRREAVAARYLQGATQATIGRALGVSQNQVSVDLAAVRARWLASAIRDFDAAKAQELARIDLLEATYWDAWQRSQQPREVRLTEAIEGGETPRRKASVRTEGQVGDASFLDGVMKCITRRCALLGLDAPQRFQIAWDDLSDAQLERLARGEPPQKVLAEA